MFIDPTGNVDRHICSVPLGESGPQVILTENSERGNKAIETCFPEAVALLCTIHVCIQVFSTDKGGHFLNARFVLFWLRIVHNGQLHDNRMVYTLGLNMLDK